MKIPVLRITLGVIAVIQTNQHAYGNAVWAIAIIIFMNVVAYGVEASKVARKS